MIAELGMPVDLDLVQYRRLRVRVIGEDLRSERLGTLGMLTCLVVLLPFSYLTAHHFQASPTRGTTVSGILLSWLLLLLLSGVLQWGLRRFPRAGLLVSMLFLIATETAAGLIVYSEVGGSGPIHSATWDLVANPWLSVVVQAVLLFALFLTGALLLAPIIVWSGKRRRVRWNPSANAVNDLFRCIELAHDREQFRQGQTRYRIVTHTHEVARILQDGLWRTMPVRSPLAVEELKRRCLHAGQSIEILCATLVLPDASTRERYLIKTIRLAETLLSGNLGDLPDDADRAAYTIRNRIASAKRLAVKVAVSVIPMAAALVQWRFHIFPASVDVPFLTFGGAWLATFALTAVSRHYPDEISRFPEALNFTRGGK
ncbi:hypothetical protein AB0J55_12820 [Amycolatopsis sp. NPDC049688]|uniref:hypothetical protein n=1 Tax=Amycolatopsis sp. NPDC049688 TaxID=3154733 RepID=UPI00341FA691